MTGTSVEGEREVSLFASLSLIVNSNIPQKVIASDWGRADSILITWMRMRQTGVAPPHEGRDSTAFKICVIVMLSYRKHTIQVYWLVVFLVLQKGAIAKWLKIETKDWKDTARSHTTHKANQQWFPKNQETPSWSPHTKINGLYLERMNSLVYILSWCFLRSVSDNCRHFSVYRIKNCKHT